VADTAAAPSGSLSFIQRLDALPIDVNGQTVGYLLPEGGMGGSRSDETYLVGRLTQAAIVGGAIAAALALLLAIFLAAGVMRPIRLLTHAAQTIEQGDLGQRVVVQGNDELAVLGRAFNAMAGSLQQAQQIRKALTADIAHELRTPLAVQRAQLEALQDGIDPLTLDSLAPILEQNLLLTRLVDDLRTLALADAGQLALDRAPTDLTALLERLAARFRPQAEQRQVRIITHLPEQAIVLSLDAQRIDQILGNLLSNALRHTPAGGQIWLSLAPLPAGARLEVRDSGPGLPPEALEQIFERFTRLDRSRSRSDGGAGLGLAIARRLAEAHGGSLTAANHPDGGAVFTLTL
jgi:signal transduction histidine kinase